MATRRRKKVAQQGETHVTPKGHHASDKQQAGNGGSLVLQWIEVLLTVMPVLALNSVYNVIGWVASQRGLDYGPKLWTPIDHWVPYAPAFVLPYTHSIAFPMALAVVTFATMRPQLPWIRRLAVHVLCVLAVHYTLYLTFPTSALPVRLPAAQLGTSWFGRMVAKNYALITHWNACPSFHVSGMWSMLRGFAFLLGWRDVRVLVAVAWFTAMTMGTVTIKIHYAVDAVAGLCVAETVHRLVFRRYSGAWQASRWTRWLCLLGATVAVVLASQVLQRWSHFQGSGVVYIWHPEM